MCLLSLGLVEGKEEVGQEGRKKTRRKGRKVKWEGVLCVSIQVRPVLLSPLLIELGPLIMCACSRVCACVCVGVLSFPTLAPPSIEIFSLAKMVVN